MYWEIDSHAIIGKKIRDMGQNFTENRYSKGAPAWNIDLYF
jgi:hypothetical protein